MAFYSSWRALAIVNNNMIEYYSTMLLFSRFSLDIFLTYGCSYRRNAYSLIKSPSPRAVTRRVPNVEFYGAGRHGRAPLRCYSEMTNHNVYNARAFCASSVLVHVGAPVREVAFHSKRYIRVLSLSLFLSVSPRMTLPLAHFHPSSYSPLSASSFSLPLLSFRSLSDHRSPISVSG